MSSSHESVGDLVPQDMLEVFAQEKLSKRGKRTRRRGTFSKAFTWLKGRRRKAHRPNKDINIDLLVSGSPLEIPLPITAPNKNSETPLPVQHFHKNVFIEGNRPKHVEDLHIEAQEGLKLLQQDENRNGVDYQDDQSVISTVTARTDDDMSFSELGMSECESTTADTISTRSMRSTHSTISYQSSRSGLTRQGSTFRPLKEDRKHAKSKSKRRAMCNIPGMPRHVQKELGLDRVAWTASQFTDAQLSNGGVSISTVVPTLDGISIASNPEGALMLLQNMNSAKAMKENIPQRPLGKGQRDDHSLLWQLLPQSSDPQKPGSLAAPWVNTSGNSPSSPVIFVSPEATYMSKIIPNAILPPSVDVVELKRNRSRSSVRMVSKSSLASASPAPTRASSRASQTSSRPSSRFSSRLSSRASSYRTAPLSQCSEWSNSESSETLVSDSSTISSSSTPRVASRTSQVEITDGPLKLNDNKIVGQIVFGKHAHLNSGNKQEESWKKAGTTGPFGRSLSVTKKSKKPPPPPSRSMSLNMKHSHTVAPKSENQSLILIDESSGSKDNGSWKIESPYSSYTHQNDMPNTVLSKGSNSEFSHWTKLKNSLPYIKGLSTKGAVPSPSLMALMALLDIPDPPIVLAPPPPPPETWAHNQRTFELLCGPGPVNFEAWAQKRGLKIEHPVQKPLGYIPKTVSVPGTSLSVKLNETVVSTLTEKSEQSKEKFQRNKAINGMKDNFVAPNKKTQSQNTITLIMKSRNTLTSLPFDTQSTNSNTISLSSLTQLYPSPCPSTPPGNQVKLISDVSTQKAQIVLPADELICPPPHPLFPPPPPPVKETSPLLLHGQHETDTSYPVPKKSPPPLVIPPPPQMIPPPPQMIPPPPQAIPPPPQAIPPPPQAIPPPPQAIPPPPQAIPPQAIPPPPQAIPPPPQAIPPPPQAIPPPPLVIPPPPQLIPPPPHASRSSPQIIQVSPTKETPPQQEDSLKESRLTSAFNVPPPPPLPTDLKKEVKLITTDKQDKQPHQNPLTFTTKEESPTPMVTQSLLQMVRLRSIKSNVGRVEDSSVEIPKQQSNQEAPQKPIRRSLILSNPDLLSSSASDPKDDAQTTTSQSTPPPLNTTPVMKLKIQSGKTVQDAPCVPLELAPFSDMTKSTSQTSVADQKIQNSSFESPKQSVPDETAHLLSKSGPKPNITVQEIQYEVPELSATAEPVNQLITTDVKTEIIAQKTPNGCNKTENMPNKILLQSLPKPQSVMHTSPKVSPTHKAPPASGALSSMRLQEAIRLKTAAMSSKDSQAKRLSLHSPPPSAGGISPTSTANFIFSKSTKKVVIETASYPEWVSTKHTDSQNKNAKMPPPVAKKPRTKSEHTGYNSSETKSNTDTEHVQTAGKRAHPE